MDVYITDENFVRLNLIDSYKSFIWKERFSRYGDVQLVVPSTIDSWTIFREGYHISIDESDRLMKLETAYEQITEEGERLMVIEGRSLEARLLDRIAQQRPVVGHPYQWSFGRPAAVAPRLMYYENCYANTRYPGANFADTGIDETVDPLAIEEPDDDVSFVITPDKNLYDVIVEHCESYGMGFAFKQRDPRLVHNPGRHLTFRVYMGYDRTSAQSTNAAVIFSANLDNLENTKSVRTSVNVKNVVQVMTENYIEVVYGNGATGETSGRDLRFATLMLNDTSESWTETQERAFMVQKGLEYLSQHALVEAFDGEISQSSEYIYKRDYNLGDLVEMRNIQGATSVMRVTEQIFASDAEGDRAYPTLKLHNFVTPGSWGAWGGNKQWADMTTETWGTMP